MGLTFAELTDTPIGPISFFAGDDGLERVAFTNLNTLKAELAIEEGAPSLEGMGVVSALLTEINAFLFGLQRSFSVDINWGSIDGFQRRVLCLVAEIPYGEVITYGEIANKLGKRRGARAVGRALGTNPMPIVIPCHRVIGSDRSLHGYLGGNKTKAFLLKLEGHLIEVDRVSSP